MRNKLLAVLALLAMAAPTAQAATDIDGVVTDITGYKTAAIAVGIAIFLFVLGRKVVKRLV